MVLEASGGGDSSFRVVHCRVDYRWDFQLADSIAEPVADDLADFLDYPFVYPTVTLTGNDGMINGYN